MYILFFNQQKTITKNTKRQKSQFTIQQGRRWLGILVTRTTDDGETHLPPRFNHESQEKSQPHRDERYIYTYYIYINSHKNQPSHIGKSTIVPWMAWGFRPGFPFHGHAFIRWMPPGICTRTSWASNSISSLPRDGFPTVKSTLV